MKSSTAIKSFMLRPGADNEGSLSTCHFSLELLQDPMCGNALGDVGKMGQGCVAGPPLFFSSASIISGCYSAEVRLHAVKGKWSVVAGHTIVETIEKPVDPGLVRMILQYSLKSCVLVACERTGAHIVPGVAGGRPWQCAPHGSL